MHDRADTLLFYGSTDSGKTLELGECAKWEFARTGMISRLISADSGWDPIEELIITPENPGGIIEAWSIQSLQDPWVVLIELSEGAWPSVIQSPSGEFKLRMQRPRWSEAKDGIPSRIICADGRKVGQYLIEGLSTIAAAGLQDHARVARPLSQDVPYKFQAAAQELAPDGKESTRTMTFSSTAMAHYGQVQSFLLQDLVPRFGRLGVNRVIWTAHEAKGSDEFDKNLAALGPATVGKAQVDKTTLKFGHSFHFTVDTRIAKDPKGQDLATRDFRAWFVSHADETFSKLKWPAKVSLSKERSLELLKRFPGGYISRNASGMGQFLDFLSPQAEKVAG